MTPRNQFPEPDGIVYLELSSGSGELPDFRVSSTEGHIERVIGVNSPLLVGRSLRATFPTPRIDAAIEEFVQVLATGIELVRESPAQLGVLPVAWIGYRATRDGNRLRVEVRDLTAEKLSDVRHAATASQRELLFHRSPMGIVIHGPDGRIVDANPAFARMIDFDPVALIGQTLADVAGIQTAIDEPAQRTRIRAANGVVHAVEVTASDLPHGYRQLLVRDVTALEESEERFRATFEEAGAGMAIVTRDGRNLRVNRAMCQLMGYTESELLGLTWKDVIHPDDLAASIGYWDEFDRHNLPSLRSEKRYYHHDGHEIWVQVILSRVRDDAGDPLYYLAQVEDISERRRLAEALRDSEERFRSAFEQSAVGMALLSPTAETLRINQALADILDHDLETARTLQWYDILHPDDQDAAQASMARVARGEVPSSRAERRYMRRDGAPVWVHVTVSSVLDREGNAVYLLAQIEDISDRRRLTSERQAMEERLELVLDATEDGIWDWQCETGESYFGPQWFGMLGYPALGRQGTPEVFTELVHPDDGPAVWAANEAHRLGNDGGTYDQTFRMRRADGTWAWIRSRGRVVSRDASGRALRMAGTHSDVSAQRELEAQFRQAQKMEAVGKLAGGVAHDFNNLIAAISATSELLLDDLDPNDHRREDVQNIALACDRAKTLTRQLLAFSRQEVERHQVIAIDDVVDEIRPLLQRVLAADQRLAVRRAARDLYVRIDPAQLEMALMNLVANARDAMPNGGDVVIMTSSLAISDPAGIPGPPLKAGTYVTVQVTDTGVGIGADVRPRLFEPFFTTKPHGKGTGLGLATVFGFAERLGGTVTVESSPGMGSTFTIYLPTTDAPMVAPIPDPAPRPAPRSDHRRILVVDDEAVVRRTTRRLLERRGFTVVEAADAEAAIAVLAEDDDIEIVLSDHAMPGRTGRQLLQEIEQRYPHVRRVLMSGFAGDGAVREVLRDLEVPFVAKPFTVEELLSAVGR